MDDKRPSVLTPALGDAALEISGSDLFWEQHWKKFAWGLAALAVLVCLRWQVHFSRTIFRAITPTLFLMLLSHAYLRFVDRRQWGWAVMAGLWLGGGLYTYLSWRLVPLLVALWVGHGLWNGRLRERRGILGVGIMGVVALVVARRR
jgi:hypothetical protein